MNKKQILRAYRKMWKRMTATHGYQPWGYDLRPLNLTEPAFMAARKRLQALYTESKR